MDLRASIREMPGKNRCDLSLLLRDAERFARLIGELKEPFQHDNLTHVAGIDAMGFVLGGPVAIALRVGFIAIRKGGKSAWSTNHRMLTDYSNVEKSLHLVVDALDRSSRVLLVDDWTETGTQLDAARDLCEAAGATVVGAAVINADPDARQRLQQHGFRLHSVIHYQGV